MMIRSLGGLTFPLVVKSSVETGIFTAMGMGLSGLDEIASALDLDKDALRRLFRALSVTGIVTEDEKDKYNLTAFGSVLVPGNAPFSVSGLASYLLHDSTIRPMMEMSYSIRTGKPSLKQDETAGWYSENPERSKLMDSAMEIYSSLSLPALIGSYPFGEYKNIIDIAGGVGHMLAGLLKENKKAAGVLFELPATAKRASEYLKKMDLTERCRIIEGDMLESVPEGGDLYLLSKTLNNWDDAHAVSILKNLRRVMNGETRLVLVEMIRNEENPSHEEVFRDLLFLTCSNGGRTRTRDEFEALLSDAALKISRIIPVHGEYPIMECIVA